MGAEDGSAAPGNEASAGALASLKGIDRSKVHYGQRKKVTRDVLDLNECVLEPLIRLLGSRVSVDTIEFHVEAFYKFLEIPASGPSPYALAVFAVGSL